MQRLTLFESRLLASFSAFVAGLQPGVQVAMKNMQTAMPLKSVGKAKALLADIAR
jgi:hypothetical protein